MIIETCGSLVRISGTMRRNYWPVLRSAIRQAVREGRGGVIIDCASLRELSPEGAATFAAISRDRESIEAAVQIVNMSAACHEMLGELCDEACHPVSVAASVESVRAGNIAFGPDW